MPLIRAIDINLAVTALSVFDLFITYIDGISARG
jgi:hypothetical protein